MILTSPKKMEHELEIEPAPNWQVLRNTKGRLENKEFGTIQDAWPMPRTRELKGVQWRRADVILGSNLRKELDHQPPDHRPSITRPSTVHHSSKVDHSQPHNDENLTSTKESKTDPKHEPQVRSLEEKKQVATDVWNEPDCPMTRSRTKELKKIIGGILQATAQLGDDISLGNSKEERPEPEHMPKEDNRQDEELGGIKDALLTPRTKKLKDQWKFAQRLIKAPVQLGAKPSTLVLIQA